MALVAKALAYDAFRWDFRNGLIVAGCARVAPARKAGPTDVLHLDDAAGGIVRQFRIAPFGDRRLR
jgi:hypothetical protein